HVPELNGGERLHREQDLADLGAPSLEVGLKLAADRLRELLLLDQAELDRDAAEEAADRERLLVVLQDLLLALEEAVELRAGEQLAFQHQRAERLVEAALLLHLDHVLQ